MADKLDGSAIVANTIPGTKIQSGTITTTQLDPAIAAAVAAPLHPKISSIVYPGNDTAANTGGGDSIVIRGSGFGTNVQVYINGTAAPSVTRNNANAVTITTAAQSAGTYLVYLINTDDGGTAILVPGIQYSGMPSWVTTSPLDSQQALSAWSISLSATGDTPITYALQAGSSLPAGITLAANGLISGTMTSPPESDTTYNFTVLAIDPQLQDTPKAFSVSVTVIVDPQFQYTTLLLQADGTNNGNNHAFLDSSNNNFTITRNGNATQGSFTPFSPTGWSNYFDGTGDYLTLSSNSAFSFGTGDFTVETWVYVNVASTYAVIIGGPSGGTTWYLEYSSTRGFYLYDGGTALNGNSNVITSQWIHLAVSRSGTSLRMFVNGINTATYTNSQSVPQIAPAIGAYNDGTYPFNGYISNLRLVKGTALYTSNFTPSTTPLTAVANTVLLTCQSNRFRDASTNNFAITRNGDVSVQTFSPFATTTAYSPATHGGAAFFDGSGDYLSTNATQAIPATGDFTIEAWVYSTVSGPGRNIVSQGTTGSSGRLQLNLHTDNTLQLGITSTLVYSTGTVTPFAWNYVAVTRTGSSVTFYINGVNAGTATLSGSVQNTALWIGSEWSGDPYRWLGYISSVRISNNIRSISAVTSPFLSDANTVFLANFTNAQIYDADASIVLETVGDAKVNTAIKKYGAGSIAFDGTGDYLKFPVSADLFNPYRGEYTVEMWVYPVSLASGGTGSSRYGTLMCQQALGSSIQWGFGFNSSGNLVYTYWNGSSTVQITSNGPAIAANTWSHVGFTYTSSGIRLFTNGLLTSATAMTGTPSTSTTESIFIGIEGRTGGSELYYNGYIDDLRITKGLARYRYNFTPPTRAFPTKGGTAPAATADEDFEYTTLLLPGNGTNNQNNHTFLDSSNNNLAITRNGNATQGTFSPFSQTGWSNYFDGSGDNLTAASNAAFSPGTGDFTYESWIYPLNWSGTTSTIFVVTNTGGLWIGKNSSNFVVRAYGVADQLQTTSFPAVNQWTHVAVARSGTTLSLYYNGTRIATTTNSYNFAQAGLCIGDDGGASAPFAGYISNSRLVKGTAVYDPTQTTVTVPTAKLTTITNTSILTCSTNRFVDESTNNFTLTRNGDTSVQAFSPFAPTASYAAANVGGSGYFDGTDDALILPSNSALALGSGDFTVEAWVYNQSGSNLYPDIFSNSGSIISFIPNDRSSVYRSILSDDNYPSSGNATLLSASGTIGQNSWAHIAWVRSGSTITVYINGAASGTVTSSTNHTREMQIIGAIAQGASPNFYFWNGYISNLRIVKGTAVYTSNFTPPTALLTNIANTSLLTNFTNAGITDATAKTIFETVGDAKISTAQSKFGGSSILFDGTGDRIYRPAVKDPLTDLGIGGENFTVEQWVYFNSVSGTQMFSAGKGGGTAGWNSSSGHQYLLGFLSSGSYYIQVWNGSGIASISFTSPFVTGQWYHHAITYDGTTTRVFINGIQYASGSISYVGISSPSRFVIGDSPAYDGPFNGYIDDFRITKGIARYVQNFTPPTSAHLTR